jgi:hypothetical protein
MNTLDSVSGYYKLGDTVIQNKLQALTDPALNGRHLEYVFHDDVYSQLNWAVEPAETLEQLYVRRAWEIREKYDYLVIHFSGGSDSTNILETFLKNNIPFEELYSRGRRADIDPDPSNTSADNTNAEVLLNAVPIVDYVIVSIQKSKLNTLLVTTKTMFKIILPTILIGLTLPNTI